LSKTAGESMGRGEGLSQTAGESMSQTAGESMSQTARRVPPVQEKKHREKKQPIGKGQKKKQTTPSLATVRVTSHEHRCNSRATERT
jgi:hypothetical protein